ncbi:MAG: carboxypeptidase regulatory-like domain-containing protein [Enhygromyxa sp.]
MELGRARDPSRWWSVLVAVAVAVLVVVVSWLLARERAADTSNEATELRAPEVATEPAWIADDPTELRPRSATISGSVRDPAGSPIAGAQVCAWALDEPRGHERRCTRSDGEGRYQLFALAAGRLTLHASAPGFLPSQARGARVQLLAGEARERVDLVLAPGGVALRGVARDISGGVVEGAWVVARPSGFGLDNRFVARSDGEGRFVLWTRPGRVDLTLEAEGYASASRLALAPGPSFDVFLIPESAIVGRVRGAESGAPLEGVTITATAQGSRVEPANARSDAAGRFRIDRLEPGIYALEARADELYGEGSELVHLGLVETVADVVIELHPAFAVRGRVVVVGSGGERSCAEGFVRLSDRVDERSVAAATVREGEVELRGVIPGAYEVTVHCEGAIAEREYPDLLVGDASRTDRVWTVQEGQAIHGVVVDGDAGPVAGVRVRASMRAPAGDPAAPTTDGTSAPSLGDGSFSVTGLASGTYELEAELWSTTGATEVVLSPGADARDVELVLAPQGTIAGLVRDEQGEPIAKVTVQLAPERPGPKLVAVSDHEGRFRLEHVPRGSQRIVAVDEGAVWPGPSPDDEPGVLAQVESGETTQVELVLRRPSASVRGRVLDSDGSPVSDAFVRQQRMTAAAWSSSEAGVLTDPDGRFELDGLFPATPYRIGAFRRGGGEAIAEGVEGGDVLTLTLIEPAEIAGRVLAADGSPPDRFRVTVHRPSTRFIRSDELFRSRGRFRIQELPPGEYVVLVESPAGVAHIEGIHLEAGERGRELDIILSPRVTVRGRIVDQRTHEPVSGMIVTIGLQGTRVRFGAATASELARTSRADGRFEVAHAPPGKVRVSIEPRSLDSGYEWQWLELEVPGTGDVVELGDLEIAPARAR